MSDATREKIRMTAVAYLEAMQELSRPRDDDHSWIEHVAEASRQGLQLDELVRQHEAAKKQAENLEKRTEALLAFVAGAPALIVRLAQESPTDAKAVLAAELEAREKRAEEHDRQKSGLDDVTRNLKELIAEVRKSASSGAAAAKS